MAQASNEMQELDVENRNQAVSESASGWFPEEFEYQIDKLETTDKKLTLWCRITSAEDFQQWLDLFRNKSGTSWIVNTTNPSPVKFTYSRDYMCHFGAKNKTKAAMSTKSTKCKAVLTVRVRINWLHKRKHINIYSQVCFSL